MKRRTAVIAALWLGAVLCACSGAPAGQTAEQSGQQTEEQTVEQAEEQTAEETEATEAEQAPQAPVCETGEQELSEAVDDVVTAQGTHMTIRLTDESAAEWPQLARSVELLGQNRWDDAQATFEEISGAAASFLETYEGEPEEFPAGHLQTEIQVIRSDDKILSLLDTWASGYPGAAHDMVSFKGYTYDTASGEPIALSDIVADLPGMGRAVSGRLVDFEDQTYTADWGLEDYFDENGDLKDNLVWTVDAEGITFYFAPYELAPYAVGPLHAQIPFEGYPDLFTENWR